MSDYEAARWEKRRARGLFRFIILFGVLLWGVPVGLIWPVAMSAIMGWKLTLPFMLLSLAVFMTGGILFGRRIWNLLERRYAARSDSTTK